MNMARSPAQWGRLSLYPASMLILSPLLYVILVTFNHGLWMVESFQVFLLLLGAVISGYLAHHQKDKRIFWLWAMMWWIVLFGRSINWGRLIWPDYSRTMFHMIAAILIAILLLPWVIPKARRVIINVIRQYGVPIQLLMVLIGMFIVIDQVEHLRFPFSYLTTYLDIENIDLLEEIVETFFIAGLFEFIRHYK